MPSHILALDAGTTGVTALLLDDTRSVVARATKEFTQHYPRPGWVEHDAQEILDVAQGVGKEVLQQAGVAAKDVAIGITDQRETVVVWDRAGLPIHRAIVWQDRRTAKRCRELAEHADWIRERTGLVTDPYFSATKLEWILDHADARQRATAGELRCGTIDSWLADRLTGRHVTDDTNASRTMLYDIHRSRWDPELLELFGISEGMLPEVVPSSGAIAAVQDGPLRGATLAGLVGDQQAALFGQGCTQRGEAKTTYGTGCFLLQHTGDVAEASDHGLLTTRAASTDGTPQYALEGSVFIGGAAIQWLRDGLKMIDDAPGVNDEAAKSEGTDGVVVVPAFAGLGAPHWDADARGAVLGISRGTSRRHIARATLESIAWQCHDVIQAMEDDSGTLLAELRVDGGAAASDLLMQFQADILQRPVRRPADLETTALGAADLAALATGAWSDAPERAPDTLFEPAMSVEDVAARRIRWEAALDAVRAFKPDAA